MGPLDILSGAGSMLPISPREPRIGPADALPPSAVSAASPAAVTRRFAEMSREELRPLLSSYFQQYWNSPDELAAVVTRALKEGWAGESLEAAQQLARIDPQPQRGARLLATALVELGRFAEAEPLLTAALQQPQSPPLSGGDRGTLLTLLARVQVGRGDLPAAERSLWQALEADPNAEDALRLFAALNRARSGPAGELEAYRRAAELPGSWRAQLWLARNALESPGAGLPAALALYQKLLVQTPPLPAEAFARISGDLAAQGLAKEMVALWAPQFDAARHGLPVGEAILRAYLDLHDESGARQFLGLLLAQQRPDWRERLRAWENELSRPYPAFRPSAGAPARAPAPASPTNPPEVAEGPSPQSAPSLDARAARPGVPWSSAALGASSFLRPSGTARDTLGSPALGDGPPPGSSPEELAAYVVRALREGRAGECLTGARQLARIDPQPQRGAHLLATTLLRLGCFPEAEKILTAALRQPGANLAQLFTLLARAREGEGDFVGAEGSLWQALETDPNAEEALHSFAALQRERTGPEGALAVYRRAAELPGSWRAPLWLAQDALQGAKPDVPGALALYEKVLLRTPPAPPEALAQLSADAAKQGLLKKLVALATPQFDAERHGLSAGSALIRACLDLGDAGGAQQLLQLLYVQPRPEWREALQFWQRELDKRHQGYRRQSGASADGSVEGEESTNEEGMRILTVEGPIWARDGRGGPYGAELPAKPASAVRVAFFCGSLGVPPPVEPGPASAPLSPLPATELGRFTRGLPLFLTERVHLQTTAAASTLVPRSKDGGFVLASQPWTAAALAVMHAMEEAQRPDYVVFFHLATSRAYAWLTQFRITQVRNQITVATWEQAFDPDYLATSIDSVTRRVLHELEDIVPGLEPQPAPTWIPLATHERLPVHLSELSQALTVWCAASDQKATA